MYITKDIKPLPLSFYTSPSLKHSRRSNRLLKQKAQLNYFPRSVWLQASKELPLHIEPLEETLPTASASRTCRACCWSCFDHLKPLRSRYSSPSFLRNDQNHPKRKVTLTERQTRSSVTFSSFTDRPRWKMSALPGCKYQLCKTASSVCQKVRCRPSRQADDKLPF